VFGQPDSHAAPPKLMINISSAVCRGYEGRDDQTSAGPIIAALAASQQIKPQLDAQGHQHLTFIRIPEG